MGDAASRACCGGRDDQPVKDKARRKLEEESWGYLAGDALNDDAAKFDEAFDNTNIEMFVDLLDSTQKIQKMEERMHPWAADPQSVGALAATQLAILASREETPGAPDVIKDKIREARGIAALVKFLQSKEDDRVHAAVVALSFLSVDNAANCVEMFERGAVPHLVKLMKSNIDGMRAATAQTARNIYVLNRKYREEFKRSGGIQNLVALLDLPTGDYDPSKLYTELEAVYHVEDLILDTGEEIPEYVHAVKAAGAVRKLDVLRKVNNSDLAQAANALYVKLAD